jgi:aminoglycoside phosphotransferase
MRGCYGLLAGPLERDAAVPSVLLELADGRDVRTVWVNQLGGVTFQLATDTDGCFVKWAPAGSGLDLAGEAARMSWVRSFSVVPEIIGAGEDDAGAWLATTGLRGENAVSDRCKQDPAMAVAAIGVGLRYLHDHAPTRTCPSSWSTDDRVLTAQRRATDGLNDPTVWHETHRHLTPEHALAIVENAPPVDQLVVVPRRRVRTQHDHRRRNLVRACRPRFPRPRRPVGRPRHRDMEYGMEPRTRVGASPAQRLRV